MLEAIREHAQGWIAKIILGLIALTFAVWGVDWYFQGNAQGKPAAVVNDSEITERDFQQALQQQQESMGINPSQTGQLKGLRQQVIEQLVNTRLLQDAAGEAGLTVTSEQMNAVLGSLEPFQDKGAFSEAKLDNWLRSRGMARAQFIGMLHQDVLLRQLQFAIGEGALVPALRAESLGRLLSQQREVQEAVFDIQAYLNTIRIEDAAVEKEYAAHQQDYAMPAQVRTQYLMLSPDSLKGQISITEAEAKQYYEANQAQYQEPEQRRASHILIRPQGNDPKAFEKARAQAKDLLGQLRAAPERFAELAGKYSQDPMSAAQGGDLGSFTRDTMVKPFADAVFGMKVGELSGPVETEFGVHIIRLTGITPGARLGFDAVKGEIMEQLAEQAAQRKFAEAAERFSNLVYEQPDSLEPAAKEFKLNLQDSGWIARKPGQPGVFGNERLLDAVFGEEALRKKQNTEAIEVAANTLVAARVLEHRPEGQRPLAEVAAEIRLKLTAEAARRKAVEAGETALKAARAGQPPAGLGAPMTVSRMKPLNMTPDALKAVFRAGTQPLPQYVGLESREGYRLYRINKMTPGEVAAEQAQMIQRDLLRLAAQEEFRAYLEHARANAKISVNQDVLEQKTE